ncbi:hypothetical protein ACKWTF_013905 [Chironomus riparius]
MMVQQRILKLLNEDETHQVNMIIKDDSPPPDRTGAEPRAREKAKNYLILVTFPTEIVENIKKLQKHETWNHEAKFIVVVTERFADQFEMEVVVSGTFKLFFDYSILNVFVLIQNLDQDNLIQTFIWYPYDGNSCSNILSYNNLETIDECETFNATDYEEGKNFELRQLIPELPSRLPHKFHGCPMVITTNIWEPFVYGSREDVEDGIEIKLIRTISEKLDMKSIFKVIDDAKAFAFITEDEDTGFYADLIRRKVDVMIGGLYDNDVSRKLLSTTIPYLGDEMTWCVRKSELAPNWMNIFIIFDVMMWIYVWLTILLATIFMYNFVRIENRRNENIFWSFVITLCLGFGICAHYEPRRGFLRFFIACMLFFGLNFAAAYQSFLLSVLTTPRYDHQVATIHEAIHGHYKFTGAENLKARFNELSDDSAIFLQSHYKSCYDMDRCLLDIKSDGKLAFAISRAHAMNAKVPVSDQEIFCFEKAHNIFSFSVVMLFKKDHHLLPMVNTLIRRITESGFILKWQSDCESIKFQENLARHRNDDATVNRAINLDQLIGLYGLGAFGVSLATLAFGFEWIIYYLAHKKKIKFVRFIEAKMFKV